MKTTVARYVYNKIMGNGIDEKLKKDTQDILKFLFDKDKDRAQISKILNVEALDANQRKEIDKLMNNELLEKVTQGSSASESKATIQEKKNKKT